MSFPVVPSSSVDSKAMVVWGSRVQVVDDGQDEDPSSTVDPVVALWSSNTAIVVWVPVSQTSRTVHSKQVAVVHTTTLLSTQVACYYSYDNDDDDDCPVAAHVDLLLISMGLVAWVASLFWVLGNRRKEQHQGPIVVNASALVVVIAVVPPVVVDAVAAPTGAIAEWRPRPDGIAANAQSQREDFLKDPLAFYKFRRITIEAWMLRGQRRQMWRKRAAARRLQAMARMNLARVQMAKLKRKVAAAQLLQQTWRSYRSSFLPLVAAPVADDDNFPLTDHHVDDDDDDEELLGLAYLESEAAVCLQAMALMYLAPTTPTSGPTSTTGTARATATGAARTGAAASASSTATASSSAGTKVQTPPRTSTTPSPAGPRL
jgi:hypothetical protein